eukprot:159334_1
MPCEVGGYIGLYGLTILCLLNASSVVFWAYNSKGAFGNNKMLYYSALIYFSFIILNLVLWAAADAFYCFREDMYILFEDLGSLFVGLQYITLILIMYLRLVVIFENTAFILSNTTKIVFYILYGCFISLTLTTVALTFTPLFYTQITSIIMGLLMLLFFGLIVMLIGLFIYKLVKVLKAVHGSADSVQNKSMIAVITKTFLLTISSIVSAGFLTAAVLISSALGIKVYVLVISGIFANTDLLVNSLSVSLGFKKFDKYYMRICGACHGCCIDICSRIVIGKSGKELHELERLGSRSGKSTTISPPEVTVASVESSGAPTTPTCDV